MNTVIASAVLLSSAIQMPLQANLQQNSPWSPEEIIQTKMLSDVQLSPDNQTALFVSAEPKMGKEKGVLVSRIYKASIDDEEKCMLFSARDYSSSQPRWSPDGKWIAFLSNRNGANNLYVISANGGEANSLTNGNNDVQTFAWSPDGNWIAFVMHDQTEEEKNQEINSLAYEYKKNEGVNRLWVIPVFAPETIPKALTSDEYCVKGSGDFGSISREFDWSPDSKSLVFSYTKAMSFDLLHTEGALATVEVSSGHVHPWKEQAIYEGAPRYSPDGEYVAHLACSCKERYAYNRKVVLRTKNGEFLRILAPTFNDGNALIGSIFLEWDQQGKDLLFFEPKHTKFHLVALPVDGSDAKEIETSDVFFKDPVLSKDKKMLGFIAQTTATAPEAYISKIQSFSPQKISTLNTSAQTKPQIKTDVISWKSQDGTLIEGLLTFPLDYEEGKKYPLLLVVHGGPMGFFDESFLGTPNPYPLASFAESGFLILRPNPRGSTGYGRAFRSANYHDWGGDDFLDIMTGVDYLAENGLADPQKMGVMGWSYGGYMTSWIVSQTNKFKAASVGAGISNLFSMAGTTDLHSFNADYLGEFTDSLDLYLSRSPLVHVSNIEASCLIQHGTADKRVPISQAYELYHALNRQGKKPTLIVYPEMGHRLTDPNMQLDAMKANLAWFKKHLLSSSD